MVSVDSQRLMVKIARKYYEEDLTQAEIAAACGISRQKVQRLLDQGRKDGLIRIFIRPPLHLHEKLESSLEGLYGLREAVVADVEPSMSGEMIRAAIGLAAAEYLLKNLLDGLKITLSWGETLLAMARSLSRHTSQRKIKNITLIQGLGFVSDPTIDTHSYEIVNIMAEALRAKKFLLMAPGIAADAEAREMFLRDPGVSEVLNMAGRADIAFLGIGTVTPETLIMRKKDGISPEEREMLRSRGAVGDVLLRYYDGSGRLVPSEIDRRVVGLTLEEISSIPTVAALAGGPGKAEAIAGALGGKLVNVLITDHLTARELIELKGEGTQHST